MVRIDLWILRVVSKFTEWTPPPRVDLACLRKSHWESLDTLDILDTHDFWIRLLSVFKAYLARRHLLFLQHRVAKLEIFGTSPAVGLEYFLDFVIILKKRTFFDKFLVVVVDSKRK